MKTIRYEQFTLFGDSEIQEVVGVNLVERLTEKAEFELGTEMCHATHELEGGDSEARARWWLKAFADDLEARANLRHGTRSMELQVAAWIRSELQENIDGQ